jgi:stress responsive alpha/beta barrel protein
MNTVPRLITILLVTFLSTVIPTLASADADKSVSHVVLIWLKQPGDAQARQQFVKASKQLNDLPGIISRHVGVVVPSDRVIVDDTFDVAITVTLKNQQALDAYMNHPRHKEIVDAQLKPLVNRIVAYDFVSE